MVHRGANEPDELRAQMSEVMSISTVASTSGHTNGNNAASDAAPAQAATATTESQPVILTPSRLRIDSRVLAAHATSQWLMNSLFAVLILLKLGGPLEFISWFSVFAPQWIGHGALYCLQIAILLGTVCAWALSIPALLYSYIC